MARCAMNERSSDGSAMPGASLRERLGNDATAALEEYVTTVVDSGFKGALQRTEAQFIELRQEISFIRQDMAGMKQDMAGMKQDMAGLKQDMAGLKQDMAGLKQDMAGMKQDMAGLKQDVVTLKSDMELFKIELRSDLATSLANQRVELMKWMFTFWVGQAAVTVGLILAIK